MRGNTRVADIYFTELNRLFNHYCFRSVTESTAKKVDPDGSELFLKERPQEWLRKYARGKLKAKRLAVYVAMKGFSRV